MKNNVVNNYMVLNELARQGGIVVMGGTEDMKIPLCELKQAFELNTDLYNRSVPGLSVDNARGVYDSYIAALKPECILMHVGEADVEMFKNDPDKFDQRYREMIKYIRVQDPKCELISVSVRNRQNDQTVAEMNKHIQYIAESEQCQYSDIATKRVWNPKETQSVVSFIYSIGFVHPLKNRHPLGDIIRILFCYDQSQAS